MRDLLNLPAILEAGELNDLLEKLCEAEALIEEGHAISEPRHLFSRIEDEVIQRQVEKLQAASGSCNQWSNTKRAHVELKPEISYEDFIKLDLRTATILSAEKSKRQISCLKLNWIWASKKEP